MFYILTERVVKVSNYNSSGGDKFAPRTNNRQFWTISGPFVKRALAERASASCLETHTCISAKVVSKEQLEEIAKSSHFQGYDNGLQREATQILRMNSVA